MTWQRRIRSRQIETDATNKRTTGKRSVERAAIDERAVGPAQMSDLAENKIAPRSVRKRHLHHELLPWPPPSSGGGVSETFRLRTKNDGSNVFLAGAGGRMAWQPTLTSGYYMTSGVSLSSPYEEIDIPTGLLWDIHVSLSVSPDTTAPTAGEFQVQCKNAFDNVTAEEIAESTDYGGHLNLSVHWYLSSATNIPVQVANTLDEDVEVFGLITAVAFPYPT